MCVHLYGQWRPAVELGVVLNGSPLHLLRHHLWLNLELTIQLNLASHCALECAYLYFQSPGITIPALF